jgi:hypothetical protein
MTSAISSTSSSYSSNINKESVHSTKKPIFVAITGRFNNNGEDKTAEVNSNVSETARIFLATKEIAKSMNKGLDAQFVAPGETCDTTVKTASDFINNNYQQGDPVIVYGYSNGGRCAMDLVTDLQKKQKPVDLLLTVDATDNEGNIFSTHNATVDTTTPANVKLHYNFYETDQCGFFKCPKGAFMEAESPESTKVINHQSKASDLNDTEYQSNIHRYMESINKDEILNVISSTLKSAQ